MTRELDRYTDPVDQASQITDDATNDAVAAIRRAAAPEQVPDENGTYAHTHCIEEDCGEELPIERLRLGKVRCVTCQSLRDKRASVYRR